MNLINGLFYVASAQGNPDQHIYQVRGQDITNLTIVETDSGIILIDPCQTVQTFGGSAQALPAAARPQRSPPGQGRHLHPQP